MVHPDAGAANEPAITGPARTSDSRRFLAWMALPLGLAALIQVIYLWDVHRTLYHNGDAVYYNVQAKLITQGHWFVNPYDFGLKGVLVPSASHPPLMSLVLAGADEVGATTWTWHMVAMAILFVAAVFVAGLAGRQLAGPRAGVVVATVVAAYPYLWMNPAAVLAENLEVLLAALAMWATVRFWKRPRPWIAGELGVYLGLAILTRSELVLLLLAIAAPALIVTRGLTPRARLGRAAVLALGVLVVVGPWVGRNLTTFHHPELLSSEGGAIARTTAPTLAGGPSPVTWPRFRQEPTSPTSTGSNDTMPCAISTPTRAGLSKSWPSVPCGNGTCIGPSSRRNSTEAMPARRR
jgi:hypothetical protein